MLLILPHQNNVARNVGIRVIKFKDEIKIPNEMKVIKIESKIGIILSGIISTILR